MGAVKICVFMTMLLLTATPANGDLFGFIASAALGAGAIAFGGPFGLAAIGYTSSGIAAGSVAAGMMSASAPVAAGSVVALMQSAGAVGAVGAGAKVVGAAAAAAIYAVNDDDNDEW